MNRRVPLFMTLACLLLAALAGCDRKRAPPPPPAATATATATAEPDPGPSPEEIERAREAAGCRLLIRTAKDHAEAIGAATSRMAATSSPDDIDRLASSLEAGADALGALPLASPTLRRLSTDYQRNLLEMAALCHTMATSARRGSLDGLDRVQSQFAEAQRRDTAAVRRINAYCAPGR